MRSDSILYRFAIVALIGLSIAIYLGNQQSLSKDSLVHASLALEVTRNGIKPILPIPVRDSKLIPAPGIFGFNDHPFTLMYVNGHMMRWLGPSAWSAKLLPSLLGVGCVAVTTWIGTLLYSPAAGLMAGIMLLSSRTFGFQASSFHLDIAMILFILLSFAAWIKNRIFLMGISAGVGVWLKSPMALLVFPAIGLSLLLSRNLNKEAAIALIRSSLVALFTSSIIWILTGWLGGGELVSDYFVRQVFGTAVLGVGHNPSFDDYWSQLQYFALGFPFPPLLLASIYFIIWDKRWREPCLTVPIAAAIVVLVTVSLMRFKYFHYYLPMLPFLALMSAGSLQRVIDHYSKALYQTTLLAGLLLPSILLASPGFIVGKYPALDRFNSIIQSNGTCTDKVLFINGHHPDTPRADRKAIAAVSFYANRETISVECAETNQAIERIDPKWIIVAGPNLEKCIAPDKRKKFPVAYRFLNQYLLSSIIDPDSAIDLTPFAKELRAAPDCK